MSALRHFSNRLYLAALCRVRGAHSRFAESEPQCLGCHRFLSQLALATLLAMHSLYSAWADAPDSRFALAAQQAYQQAQTNCQSNPKNIDAAWQFGRACFDLADFSTNNAQRASLAQQGIDASRRTLSLSSNCAPGHYYLGLNLGQLARTKSLGALKLVGQMEREFNIARELDEHFDYAGADRSLGLLYRDAPTIGSIGSRSKARQHLQRALKLAPDFPENRLNLIESELKWGERNPARQELASFEEGLTKARAAFTGPEWTASWADWEQRLESVKTKLEGSAKSIRSPREKN